MTASWASFALVSSSGVSRVGNPSAAKLPSWPSLGNICHQIQMLDLEFHGDRIPSLSGTFGDSCLQAGIFGALYPSRSRSVRRRTKSPEFAAACISGSETHCLLLSFALWLRSPPASPVDAGRRGASPLTLKPSLTQLPLPRQAWIEELGGS